MIRVVIYTRFSPRPDAADSASCDTQLAQCLDHAAVKGWEVISNHADKAVSGKTYPRPGLTAALAALGKGDVFLAYSADRIARDLRISETVHHLVEARKARVALVVGGAEGTGPEAGLQRRLVASVAQYEREKGNLRTKDAMLTIQAGGKCVGSEAPYGYRISKGHYLDDEPIEKPAVARIKQLHAEEVTNYGISKILNEEMQRVARNGKWNPGTIGRILDRGPIVIVPMRDRRYRR